MAVRYQTDPIPTDPISDPVVDPVAPTPTAVGGALDAELEAKLEAEPVEVPKEVVSEASAAAGAPRKSRRRSDKTWVWQVTGLSLAMGILLALAIRTTTRIQDVGLPNNRFGLSAAIAGYKTENERLHKEIEALRGEVLEIRDNHTDGQRSSELLAKQLHEHRALLGFAGVKGPGLRVKLTHTPLRLEGMDDTEHLVDEADVAGIINELWAAGAEAISVSGPREENPQRLVLTTNIRGDGTGMVVHGRRLTAPYHISAIGNSKELRGALEMPDGIIQVRGLEILRMISIEEVQQLVLPAHQYSGGTTRPTNESQ
jgi:uncharacterized protein YlxW (UPF0749 family)